MIDLDVVEQPGMVDATHTIKAYEQGKTWDCPECGHGIGTGLDDPVVKCASCGATLLDKEYESREPPEREHGQMDLGQFT